MRLVPIALALLATTATAADRRAPPVATAIGEPVACIPLTRIRQTLVRDDRTIDWVLTGRKTYRTVLRDSCPGLGFEQRFSYQTSLSQLCSTDIITVLYQTGPQRGASCGLAPFQPVTLAR